MPKWTAAQSAAIETCGSDVLVSAAAGSGKTASLTERIMRRLTSGASLDRILIVTFSRAAASDMRAKLTRELRRAASESPDNKNIQRALAALPTARIGTIHSFCLSLLRRYYGELGLPAKMRVADDAEAKLMRTECMDDTLDFFFSEAAGDGRDPETDFVALTDHLLGGQTDEALTSTLLSLYEKTSCLPERYKSLVSSAESMKKSAECGDFLLSDCGGAVRRHISRGLEFYGSVFGAAVRELSLLPEFDRKYCPAFEYLLTFVKHASRLLDAGDFDALCEHFESLSAPRLGSVKDGKTARTEYFKEKKTEFSAFVKGVRERFLSLGGDGLPTTLRRTASVTLGIVRVLDEFDRRYRDEKRRRGVLDYEDLEHYALRLLSDPDRARVVRADYDEIYIDEYQDVNEVQNAIFSAIADKNRFMVGDVKQSIYAFRGADPTLFDSLRLSYTKITSPESDETDGGRAVYMSDNFRCDASVVGFTNAVCGRIMPYGNVSYTDDDALRHSKAAEEPTYTPVSVLIADAESDPEPGLDAADAEPEMLASELARLLREEKKQNGEPIRPSDIAILLRSAASGRAERIEKALERHGIPVENGTKQSFFECPEVLLVLCLLNVIDNPLRDVYLAGALRSPVFGFTLDDLIAVGEAKKGPLYRSLSAVAESEDEGGTAAKCRDALTRIKAWREAAKRSTASDIIAHLYAETGIEALVFSDANRQNGASAPEVRAENLALLYDYARNYEASAFRGLHKFLDFINSLIERGVTANVGEAAPSADDAVRIMTVHQSKGLEFPVTVLAYAGASRNEKDARDKLLYEKSAGLAMPLRADDEGESSVMLETLPHRAVAAASSEMLAAEEMRILYVALTRAEERLIVTAKLKNALSALDSLRADADFYCAHSVYSEKSYLGWILSAVFAEEAAGRDAHCRVRTVSVSGEVTDVIGADEDETATDSCREIDRAEVERLKSSLRDALAFSYPYAKLGTLPAKLSVSVLTPDVLDEDATDADVSASASALSPEAEAAAKAGTATHIFMQFCDFDRVEADGVRKEASRLVGEGFLRAEDREIIRYDEAELFFCSDIYKKMRSAVEVRREMRFNVRLDASDFTLSEADRALYEGEELLVQGVIDCFFRDENGDITVVDYKTDRLSRYELTHADAAAEKLRSRHSRQLGYYADALEAMFGERPRHVYVYSMPLGGTVEIEAPSHKKSSRTRENSNES